MEINELVVKLSAINRYIKNKINRNQHIEFEVHESKIYDSDDLIVKSSASSITLTVSCTFGHRYILSPKDTISVYTPTEFKYQSIPELANNDGDHVTIYDIVKLHISEIVGIIVLNDYVLILTVFIDHLGNSIDKLIRLDRIFKDGADGIFNSNKSIISSPELQYELLRNGILVI